MISKLLSQLKNLVSAVRKNKAANVNSKDIREAAIATASYYFKECRTEVSKIFRDEKALKDNDEEWQQLIRLAHGNNSKKSYLSVLSRLSKTTTDLAVASYSAGQPNAVVSSKINHSQPELLLVQTLDKLLPSSAQSYRQGIQDLNFTGQRHSYRGTACEFREALRETLDYLAPDDAVTSQSGYKPEPNCTGPTMKQKVRFILSSRGKSKAQLTLVEKSVDLIENLCGEVARAVYNRASVSTHIQTTKDEVQQMRRYLDAVLFDILEVRQK